MYGCFSLIYSVIKEEIILFILLYMYIYIYIYI